MTDFGRTFGYLLRGSRNGFIVQPRTRSQLPERIDLILRPNAQDAADTVDITEICAGDITLPNISTTLSRPYTSIPALPPASSTRPAP